MPIYEYECRQCKLVSEFLVGVTQSEISIQCRKCGSKKMKKKISSGYVSTGAKSKKEYCAQKGLCSTPSCLHGGACH